MEKIGESFNTWVKFRTRAIDGSLGYWYLGSNGNHGHVRDDCGKNAKGL